MAAKGTLCIQPDEKGFRIGTSLPTGVPVSEIQLIEYTGPRLITSEFVVDLEQWLKHRVDQGFTFKVTNANDGTK